MKFTHLTLFFFISWFCFGQNQQKVDSLLLLIKNTSDLALKSTYESDLSEYYRASMEIEKAENIIALSIEHALSSKNPEVLARAYFILGNINYVKWDSSMALLNYQKADSILISKNIKNHILYSTRLSMGNVHLRLIEDINDSESLKKVWTYYLEALKVAQQLKDSSKQGYIYIRLGHIENAKKRSVEAQSYFKKANEYISNKSRYIKDLYYALGVGYLGVGNEEKSTFYMRKYFELRNNSGIPKEMAIGNWSFGRHLFNIGKYEEAIFHEKKSAELFNSFESVDYGRLSSINKIIYDSYENLGDYKNAFNYLLKHKVMNDSAISVSRRTSLDDIETKYQTEKKEQEITLLKTQNELTEQQKKSQRNLMLAGLGITTIAGLFLFVLYRNRQKTNAKLRELDTAKSNFFANISHEFRTPLTLISNPIDEALEDPGITDTKREKFVMAKRNSDRLLSLVNQLLDLSKIDAGQLKLHIQKSNPLQLIAALGESFNYAAKQNSINYKVDIKDTGKEAWFDKDALDKITINLLSNAIKYTPNNGSVVCNASIEDEKLFLEVKNSGGGLTKAQLSNVFQRFYQTSEENQGTGIGLALVKELVDLHKGTIKVDSIPNEFTTFTVALPVSKNSFKNEQFMDSQKIEYAIETNLENQVTQEDEEFTDNDQPILLIVEDNEDVRTLLKQTFETSYNILTASNGDIGVALALEHIPDIIISDIMMPIKDGIALTNALKNDERTSHIPIILLTAKAGEENELKGIEIGADDYITKPFSSKILITKVSKLIEIRQKLQSRYSQEVVLMPKDIAITSLDEQFLEKVQTVLDNKLVEASFSIEDFSKAVGLSRMQLHRKIKALTGLSASEFIRSQRLKLAAQLLKKSDINISQVGYTVGFNDHSYFTKCFKEAYNCTPSAYAKKHQ